MSKPIHLFVVLTMVSYIVTIKVIIQLKVEFGRHLNIMA